MLGFHFTLFDSHLVGQGERAHAAREAMDALAALADAQMEAKSGDAERTFEGGIRWFCRHVMAKVETVLFAADPAWTQQLQDVIAVCEQWLAAV